MGLAFLGCCAVAGVVYHPSTTITVLSVAVLLVCALQLILDIRELRRG